MVPFAALLAALRTIPDPRRARGTRHPLAARADVPLAELPGLPLLCGSGCQGCSVLGMGRS